MLKRVAIAAFAAGLLAAPAHAQTSGPQLLMPGVTYERQVQFTAHGPVAIHVLTAPRPTGAYALKPVLGAGTVPGRETVTAVTGRLSRDATVAGVNGDLFAPDGTPSSLLVRSSVVEHSSNSNRSSLGITADGTLLVDKVRMFGTWRGTSQRRPMEINHPPGANGAALYTPAWGRTTPAGNGTVEAIVDGLPPLAAGAEVTGILVQIKPGGGTPIPPTGAVLVTRGSSTQRFVDETPLGTTVAFRALFAPDWAARGVTDAIGGGPALVRDGKAVFRHGEQFTSAQLARDSRTGVGQLRDGRIVFVVADGRRRGYSVGMTNFELALALVRLGAVTAMALDGGGSSTLAFDGALLNRPSDAAGARAVPQCLCLLYGGVHAPPPAEAVVSPNGDGVADVQQLSYKLVRPSTVTVGLVGPDGVTRPVESGPKPAGLHRFSWNGTNAAGGAEPDGRWRLTVTAVDDGGLTTTATRPFEVNRTLGRLAVQPPTVRVRPGKGGRLIASFTLAREAHVTLRVETPAGTVVAVAARKRLKAGQQTLAWNGRAGGKAVRPGAYVVRVIAANQVGRVHLAAPVRVRR